MTLGFISSRDATSLQIHKQRHGFHVCRIHARSIATQVVDLQSVWNSADQIFIGPSMCADRMSDRMKRKDSIACLSRVFPSPTPIRFWRDFFPETVSDIATRWMIWRQPLVTAIVRALARAKLGASVIAIDRAAAPIAMSDNVMDSHRGAASSAARGGQERHGVSAPRRSVYCTS